MSKYNIFDCMELVSSSPKAFADKKIYVSTGAVDINKIDYSHTELVTYYNRPSRANLVAQAEDILFAKMFGTTKVLMLDKTTSQNIYSTGFFAVRANRKVITPKCLYYLISSKFFSEQKDRNCSGATQKAVTNTGLKKIFVNIPDIKEQEKIVKKFDIINRLINTRQQQLLKLDKLVKSRFIEMFGTENEFNKWNCCTVEDVADVCVGVVIKPTQYYTEHGIPAFRSLNIGEMQVKDNDWVHFTEEGHQKNQKSIIQENDVLVVRSGAPGTACVATKKQDGYNAVDIIIAHPICDKINPIFLAMFTNMPHGMNQIRERTGGAAQQHFNVGDYKALQLIMPPMELQERFASFIEQNDKSKFECSISLNSIQSFNFYNHFQT